MNRLIHLKNTTPLILLALVCFGLVSTMHAISPAPDGGYPGQNTAEGQSALLHLAGGTYNTAVGWSSLGFNVTGNLNTAVGAGALLANTGGQMGAGSQNTATGAGALISNTTGLNNTASGAFALFSNTSGAINTATGSQALKSNTIGAQNTAIGYQALLINTTGAQNTAIGDAALFNNTTGVGNTALGYAAGSQVITASNVICIGAAGNNVDNACYIGNIFGSTSSNGVAVLVNSNGRLGTMTSSRRFKESIQPMDQASKALFSLKPVTFRYRKEIDPVGTSQFGLVAEEVEKVDPDLIVRDTEGKPYSVRYDAVNAMVLNEFLKEHRTVQQLKSNAVKQEATIARLEQQVDALTAGLQKVSAQLTATNGAAGMRSDINGASREADVRGSEQVNPSLADSK